MRTAGALLRSPLLLGLRSWDFSWKPLEAWHFSMASFALLVTHPASAKISGVSLRQGGDKQLSQEERCQAAPRPAATLRVLTGSCCWPGCSHSVSCSFPGYQSIATE